MQRIIRIFWNEALGYITVIWYLIISSGMS